MLPSQPANIGWFDISAVDRDNLMFHLAATPSQEAWLAQQAMEADYAYLQATNLEKRTFAELFVHYKSNPYRRATSKGIIDVDASDPMAEALVKMDPKYERVQKQVEEAYAERQLYRGYIRAFETKKSFMSSLAGITRTELEQRYR